MLGYKEPNCPPELCDDDEEETKFLQFLRKVNDFVSENKLKLNFGSLLITVFYVIIIPLRHYFTFISNSFRLVM